VKPLSKLNSWAAKPPSDWQAPDNSPGSFTCLKSSTSPYCWLAAYQRLFILFRALSVLLQEFPPLQLHQFYATLSSSVTFFLAEESPEMQRAGC